MGDIITVNYRQIVAEEKGSNWQKNKFFTKNRPRKSIFKDSRAQTVKYMDN